MWVCINTIKQSPIVHPVDDLRSSRKRFTTNQPAKHSARISQTVVSIQISSKRRWSTPIWMHWYVPERTSSSGVHSMSMMRMCPINSWNLPPEVRRLVIPDNTPPAIVRARKSATRKMSIFLEHWYIAYNRVIMMTWKIFQSGQYNWDTSTEELTT